MFNCVPTIEAICMLVTIHICSASQQHLVVALTTLPTIESHMVPYKYTSKAFLQFPCILAGESPKWNILVVTWTLVICLKCIHSCPCYNYYIYSTFTPQIKGKPVHVYHISYITLTQNVNEISALLPVRIPR